MSKSKTPFTDINRFKTRYNYQGVAEPVPLQKDGRTQQQHREKCDVNRIIAKYNKTGVLDHMGRASNLYGDASKLKDLRESQNLIAEVRSMFMQLPATEREFFQNDIANYAEFMTDPKHRDGRIQRGYEKAPPPPKKETTEAKPPASESSSKKEGA